MDHSSWFVAAMVTNPDEGGMTAGRALRRTVIRAGGFSAPLRP
jgi:hypothetical protein